MFTSKDGRTLEHGTLVGVHWNSHKNCYSVVAFPSRRTEGLVLGYVDSITLTDCTFYINKFKQNKVRREQAKDRHAYVVGIVEEYGTDRKNCTNEILYNPYKYDTFHARYQDSQDVWQIDTAATVQMNSLDGVRPQVLFDTVQ